MVRQVKRKGLKDKTLKWVSQTWEKCESSVTYTTLLGCQVQSECAVYMCVHSIVDPCKWHCNLQPMIMGNSMKREQQNLIRLDFVIVTFIIIARLSKLTDLQRDRENTAGKKISNCLQIFKEGKLLNVLQTHLCLGSQWRQSHQQPPCVSPDKGLLTGSCLPCW